MQLILDPFRGLVSLHLVHELTYIFQYTVSVGLKQHPTEQKHAFLSKYQPVN